MKKSKTQKKQILVVIEDEAMLLSALLEKLSDEGYQVHGCEDSRKAVELVQEVAPDLVITDLVMTEPDGFSIIEALRAEESTAALPIMILSNSSEDQNIERATALGVADYLVKANHSLEEVTEKVADALE